MLNAYWHVVDKIVSVTYNSFWSNLISWTGLCSLAYYRICSICCHRGIFCLRRIIDMTRVLGHSKQVLFYVETAFVLMPLHHCIGILMWSFYVVFYNFNSYVILFILFALSFQCFDSVGCLNKDFPGIDYKKYSGRHLETSGDYRLSGK